MVIVRRRMESLFRMWMRDLKDSEAPDELHGELHTALGTAKWQVGFSLHYVAIVTHSSISGTFDHKLREKSIIRPH